MVPWVSAAGREEEAEWRASIREQKCIHQLIRTYGWMDEWIEGWQGSG
jgi:hypothetical protein